MSGGPRSTTMLKITIENPCTESWEDMSGNERIRHCAQCDRNVFNIASLDAQEAVDLIRQTEGSICARVFRRPDGTVVTGSCTKTQSGTNEPSVTRSAQFSISSLLLVILGAAALFAATPVVGRLIRPFISSWFDRPAPTPTQIYIEEGGFVEEFEFYDDQNSPSVDDLAN